MQWINPYQLFLFDFDGLLVNTEEIHFQAYQKMCKGRGYSLPWTFERYCSIAHYDAEGIREKIYAEFPQLKELDWMTLYHEKKKWVEKLLKEGAVKLMPGVAPLLTALKEQKIKCCVVTHSPPEQVNLICQQQPLLKTIDNWVTRNDYSHPKPNPECYLKAIQLYAQPGDKIVGFEDTPRGLTALMQTKAQPVLISQIPYPEIPQFVQQGVFYYKTFESIPKTLGKTT